MKTTDTKTMSREQLEAYCEALEGQAKRDADTINRLAVRYSALLDRLQKYEDEDGGGNAADKEKDLRRCLHILYHDFAESLDGWRRIAAYIRQDEERAYEAVRTGAGVEGRIHDTARWAGAIERKTGEQRAALGLIREIAEAVTGDWLYLLDDIDD